MGRATNPRRRHLVLLAGLLAAGCSDPAATVTGEVTYDGQPVKSGYVTFAPTDGKGATAGGPVADGRYTVEKLPPGPKVAKVEAADKGTGSIQTTEDMERFTRENKGKVKVGPDGIISTEIVPPNADGNNQTVEVKAGSQTVDLHLKKPVGKK